MAVFCLLVLFTFAAFAGAANEVSTNFKSLEEEARTYIRHLFGKYGNGQVMTFEGFEHLLFELGLGKLHLDHEVSSHRLTNGFVDMHANHNHEADLDHDHGHDHDGHDHEHHSHGLSHEGHDHEGHLLVRNNRTGDNNMTAKYSKLQNSGGQGHDRDQVHGSHEGHDYGDEVKATSTSPPVPSAEGTNHEGHNHEHEGHHHEHEGHDQGGDSGRRQVRDVAVSSKGVVDTPSFASRVAFATGAPSDVKTTEPTTAAVEGEKCLSPSELLATYKIDWKAGITESHFLYLGPALITQMDSRRCAPRHSTHSKTSLSASNNKTAEAELSIMERFKRVPGRRWLMATGAVVVISLVGLVAVAMIPLMQCACYHYMIQFLVALAIGSLTGDALLHLLPHAITPHHHNESQTHDHSHSMDDHAHSHDLDLGTAGHDHLDMMWKGLVALAGIYAFFIMEQMVAILTRWKRRKKKRLASSFDPDLTLEDVGAKLSRHNDRTAANEDFMLVVHQSVRKLADDAYEEMVELKVCENGCHRNGESVMSSGGAVARSNSVRSAGNGAGKHGHSHHGHSHSVPHSVTAVAWMVIMGDGLHNFTDGLAIGAAFANSVSLGLGTSIAVICHELPHELGDFAMLLHAGMRVKQALFYNIFSSILCFIGMVFGIFVGNVSSASSWVFALTAGIFIYIALVDMLPEVTSAESRQSDSGLCYLLLQLLGISIGIGSMLFIAVYEKEISEILSDTVV